MATQVYGYDRVVYEDIYPEIDMVFYSGSAGQKLAFYCWPGSDPTKLALQFFGQDSLKVQPDGDLKVWLSGRWVKLREAAAYQVGQGGDVIPLNWAATYEEMNGDDVVNFVFDTYDPSLPIVLQIGALPLAMNTDTEGLCWSSYFGGSGYDEIWASTTDVNGNYYVTGKAVSDFLSFQNALGTDLLGVPNAVTLAKFRPNYELDWMVFYGGTDNNFGLGTQAGFAVVTRQTGGQTTDIFIGGVTESNDLYQQPLAGAYNQPTGTTVNGKGFLARFSPEGFIEWSTYFGNDGGEMVTGLDVDAAGQLCVVGSCDSTFPLQTLSGAYNGAYGGGPRDVMLARFNANCSLQWCTSIGGSGSDEGADIVRHANGFYVSGSTFSSDFPVIGGGANHNADRDVVLMDFNTQADTVWSSHHGGSGMDRPGRNSLARDEANNLIVVGETQSADMDTVSAGYFYMPTNTGTAGFIARYANGSHVLNWSTYVSGAGYNALESASFSSGKLTVAGATGDPGLPIVPNAAYYNQGTISSSFGVPTISGVEGVLMVYNATTELSYSTFFGGVEGPSGDQIFTTAFSNGNLFLAGRTSKPIQNLNAYFPHDDAGGPPAYFDESFDPAPLNYSDGFVAAICLEMNVGTLEDAPLASTTFELRLIGYGTWSVLGLPIGAQRLEVFDSKGATVHQTMLVIDAEGQGTLHLRDLAPGIYTCRASSPSTLRSAKLFIQTR
ncbi:MAG: hypothetical protein QY325_11245 [Flavobacteriales bacterium]|nr:MAG: hypothetical protein QY325_11245 [Flavobacteriales bacterium]